MDDNKRKIMFECPHCKSKVVVKIELIAKLFFSLENDISITSHLLMNSFSLLHVVRVFRLVKPDNPFIDGKEA